MRWEHPSIVALAYTLIGVAMTWPLAPSITNRVAGDTGDTLFNAWVMLWTSGQVLRALRGDVAALADYWNGNIFYPSPLTLAFSEHLTPQMLQALPVIGATGNIVLAYNLVFVATIILSGLGTFLLVRELTGCAAAGFLGGLAFAFTPYRLDQYEHIEVLSSEWMPFALYGFRRFYASGRTRALAGGTAALVAQALSCGYYMAYFTPFAVAYCLFECAAHGKLRDAGTWRAVGAAAATAFVVVGLFLWPYARVRASGDVGIRDRGEVEYFSADTYAYATVSPRSWLWGSRIQALPREQGHGFPGATALFFATVGIGLAGARAAKAARAQSPRAGRGRRAVAGAFAIVLVVLVSALVHALVSGDTVHTIAEIRVGTSPTRVALQIVVAALALAAVSPAFRALLRGVPGSPVGFFAYAVLAAAALSLGPTMHAGSRDIGPGLYALFYRWIPGYNGLRVPTLHFMIVALFVATLAGLGAAGVLRHVRRGWWIVAAGTVAILAEGRGDRTVAPVRVPEPPPIYQTVPPAAVIAEFPFGEPHSEILYTFHAGLHRKPIINGYSGFFPRSYIQLVARLSTLPFGAEAFRALQGSGATHAIVHEGVPDGQRISEWLRCEGAREITSRGPDRLFALR